MALKGSLDSWDVAHGGSGRSSAEKRISLTKYPENWLENIYLSRTNALRKRVRVPQIDRRDLPQPQKPAGGISLVPVGISYPLQRPIQFPVPIVHPVRKQIVPEPRKILAPVIGSAPPPIAVDISKKPAGLPKLPPQILNPPIFKVPERKGVIDVIIDIIKPNILPKVPSMPLDLGNLIGDIAGRYIDAKYGGPVVQPYTVPYTEIGETPALAIPGVMDGLQNLVKGDPNCLPPGYKFDKCGNVIKTRRRRRRRLATSSDIKDLAALSSVTTGGEKKTWIATHPS